LFLANEAAGLNQDHVCQRNEVGHSRWVSSGRTGSITAGLE